MKYNGLWLYGLSGVGKTYLSRKIYRKIRKSFIIDGDEFRKHISFDLGYTKADRIVQIKRVLGFAKMCINQSYFPIISTVFMNNKIYQLCKKNKIKLIRIERPDFDVIKKIHPTYKKKDVVGKDINLQKLNTSFYINDMKNKKCQILNFLKK